MMLKKLIFINPWIYDFAAHDFWAKPMGLLYLASYFGKVGYDVRLIDCLDVNNPYMKASSLRRPKRKEYGTGKFWKQRIKLPPSLSHIKRPFNRYGITPDVLRKELTYAGRPSAFLVTSAMTYWYLGVKDTIKVIKELYPDVPVILGGIYARLCPEHAKRESGADVVLTESEPSRVLECLIRLGIAPRKELKFDPSVMYPGFELYKKLNYVCIMTSKGCPYRCKYCASPFLSPDFCQRDPQDVFEELCYWRRRFGVTDFAFYDDALLVSSKSHLLPVLEMVVKKGLDLRFHTPNAIHITGIDREVAEIMYRSGFKTIRLGLESSNIQLHRNLDKKLSSLDQVEKAVSYLFKAGFRSEQIGAYILIGLPNQDVKEVIETIRFVEKLKILPFLAEYSPIPNTELWDEAVKVSELDIASEPLYHNNILIPCWDEDKKKHLPFLRKMVLEIRDKLKRSGGKV